VIVAAAHHRRVAADAWQRLLGQEERSRVHAARLVEDLDRLGAPASLLAAARQVATDEARHVELCAGVVSALGHAAELPRVDAPVMPSEGEDLEQAVAELLVAGFAVAETMSVGGFVAVRREATEPLVHAALTQIAREEVRHGAFGEAASAWVLRGWTPARRRALWPACVAAMESVERRGGGTCDGHAPTVSELAALGAPSAGVGGAGLLRAISRWVLPRLARLGVLPEVEA